MEKASGTLRLSDVVPRFLRYIEVDLGFAHQSIIKYRDCLSQITRMIGDRVIADVSKEEVLELKSAMLAKGNGTSRQVSVLSTLKRLLLQRGDGPGTLLGGVLLVALPGRRPELRVSSERARGSDAPREPRPPCQDEATAALPAFGHGRRGRGAAESPPALSRPVADRRLRDDGVPRAIGLESPGRLGCLDDVEHARPRDIPRR